MKLKVQAASLQIGDIVGSGEKVISVQAGVKTPKGKVEVMLENAAKHYMRTALWGSYTMINVERV